MLTSITASNQIHVSSEPATEVQQASDTLVTLSEAHTQQNAAIVQASIDVSINAQNEPLTLLLKTAINGINDLLKPTFGENAIQNASSQDNTPDGTAGRIVALSTGFYETFKKQHPGENEADVLSQFMATIRSGFEQGYQEASGILQGMGVLNGDIAGNVDQTHALVLQGYADFEAAQNSQPATGEPQAALASEA